RYKKDYDGGTASATEAKTPVEEEDVPAEETVPESGNSITYGTQVLVTSKVLPSSDPFFKGNPFKKYPAGKYYKYVIGFSDDLSTASTAFEKLKKSFPDSFLVKIENGEFSRIK
ncbi:MAG: hypothetical protein IIT69_04030, partial [Bacteroidales bacterium]|nr:hypothetical protein [Bacteroidales bacterium]